MIPFCHPVVADYAKFVGIQINSEFIGPGAATEEFAQALSAYTRAPYVLLTTSGTTALQVAVRTIQRGIVPGTVLCPAYGVEATANAFKSLGLFVDFIDVDRTTGCMDSLELERYLKKYPKPQAVCFVNFSGNLRISAFVVRDICERYGVPFIEDAACSLGHWYLGKHGGTVGRIGTLSFSVPKLITTGQGGAVLFERKDDYEWARNYICQGDSQRTGNIQQLGCNLRFNDILASLGLIQLEEIEDILRRKSKIHFILKQSLNVVSGESGPSLHNIIFSDFPAGTVAEAQSENIFAQRQYSVMTQHDLYASSGDREFVNAEYWRDNAVYLPFGNALDSDDAKHMCEVLG